EIQPCVLATDEVMNVLVLDSESRRAQRTLQLEGAHSAVEHPRPGPELPCLTGPEPRRIVEIEKRVRATLGLHDIALMFEGMDRAEFVERHVELFSRFLPLARIAENRPVLLRALQIT